MVVDLEPVAEKVQSVKNGVSKVAVNGVFSGLEAVRVVDGFGNLVNGKIPELINVQWVTSFAQEKFIELTQAGCRPLGFGPHFVWYDAVLASEACYTLFFYQWELTKVIDYKVLTVNYQPLKG